MTRFITYGLLFALVGCSGPTMSVVPVSGTVTLDGKPVEHASITLYPAAGQPLPAGGTTDAEGKFSMKTTEGPYELKGALPGKYKVVIAKMKYNGIAADEQGLAGELAPTGLKIEWLTPSKYADKSTTDLTCQVETGMAPLQIELKSR